MYRHITSFLLYNFYITLPIFNGPRTSRAQAAATKSVSSSEVQVGDLFFYGSGSTVNHVALYIGGGQIIHASNARDGIKISSAYYRQPLKIGRVM